MQQEDNELRVSQNDENIHLLDEDMLEMFLKRKKRKKDQTTVSAYTYEIYIF